jgi:recombination protein U
MPTVDDKPRRPKNDGKKFEEDFRKSTPPEVFVHRVKDAGSQGQHLFGVRNICDYIVYRQPWLHLWELKSHKGKSIPFGALTDTQLAALAEHGTKPGVKTAFIFNFRDLGETWYVRAWRARAYVLSSGRKSFPIEWVRGVGKRVDQQKVRTRYRYDVDKLLGEIVGEASA